MSGLRHQGCFDKDGGIGCDSGGWYRFTSLVTEIAAVRAPKPRWAENALTEIGRMYNPVSTVQIGILVFQALFPASASETGKFQGAFEQRRVEHAPA